jgi:hypothetical protein
LAAPGVVLDGSVDGGAPDAEQVAKLREHLGRLRPDSERGRPFEGMPRSQTRDGVAF